MIKVLVLPIDGYRYGFPKICDGDLELNDWLIENGYPKEHVEYWINKLGRVPCSRKWVEVKK